MKVRSPGANLAKRLKRVYDDYIQGNQVSMRDASPLSNVQVLGPQTKEWNERNVIKAEPDLCQESIRDYLKTKKESNSRPPSNAKSRSLHKFANFST